MHWQALKYLSIFTLPVTVAVAFHFQGPWTFLPLGYVFFIIPLLELLVRPDPTNNTQAEEALKKKDVLYDVLLYLVLPVQLFFLGWYIELFRIQSFTGIEQVGLITAMGMMNGAMAINVAHELGHRTTGIERWMAKVLLTTSLYTHFYIEHNRGHHKRVGTEEDPASARYNEPVYAFWLRSIIFQYINAWRLEHQRLKQEGKEFLSMHNEMVIFTLVQILVLGMQNYWMGTAVMIGFLGAAAVGIVMLETVNYIEHYGLRRKRINDFRYERVRPHHSWNSNHILGRLLLFELSRHSDHHYKANRKYQILRHHEDSPQMPTGYPGMMVLALVPPLFFRIVNPLIKERKAARNEPDPSLA